MRDQKGTSRRDFLKKTGGAGMALMVMPTCMNGLTRPLFCASNLDLLPSKSSFRVALWGDPQVAYWAPDYDFEAYGSGSIRRSFEGVSRRMNPRLASGIDLTNQLNPDFVITLGDNIHGYGELCFYYPGGQGIPCRSGGIPAV